MSVFGRSRSSRVAFACALLVIAAMPARAADDDEDFDDKIVNKVLSSVGLRDDKPQIDYRERSPLVLPPSNTLPAPYVATAAAPNWPVDPEVKAKRSRESAAKNLPGRQTGDAWLDDSRPLTPAEMEKGRVAKRAQKGGSYTEWTGRPLSPSELGTPSVWNSLTKMFDSKDKEASVKFTGEPARTSLLEPPTGYQTPSPNAPYGLGKQRGGILGPVENYYENFGTMR